MKILSLIQTNKLKLGDSIVIQNRTFKMLNNHFVYLGRHHGAHKFMGNFYNGVRILSVAEISEIAKDLTTMRIEKFNGTLAQRNASIERALIYQDQTSYQILLNNYFNKNLPVTNPNKNTAHTDALGKGLLMGGLITAAASRNKDVKTVGFIAAFLGLMALAMED